MDEALLKRARECRYFRGALLELAAELPADDQALDLLLARAVTKRDNPGFGRILLAALGAGRRVDAHLLTSGASLLDDPGQVVAAAMHASGDVARALIEAVVFGHVTYERQATTLLLAGIWWKEKGNAPVPPDLIAQARVLSRRVGDNPFARLPLLALADLIQDEGLSAVLKSSPVAKSDPLLKDFVARLVDPVRNSPLGLVPEHAGPVMSSGFTVRRAVVRVGRNDPCPCGSGKKYKKCCVEKDRHRLQESSSVPGLTVEELRGQRERFLTKDELLNMRSHELAQLDPVKVEDSLKPLLINLLHRSGELEAVVELFEKTGVPAALEGHWGDAVDNTSLARRKDLLLRLVKLREGSTLKPDELRLEARLLLAGDAGDTTLKLMEEAALDGVKPTDGESAIELAYALLQGEYPALGILVGRGVISTAPYFEAVTLFDTLLEARDKLNLPPDDPVQSLIDQRFQESSDTHRDSKALKESHDRLESKSQEVGQLKSRLVELHSELEKKERENLRKQAMPPSPLQAAHPPVDEGLLHDLRSRVASLRGELNERHSERNQLRRDLKAALDDIEALRTKNSTQTEPAKEESEQAEERLLDADEAFGTQPVRIPEFPRKFIDSVSSLPPNAVRHCMTLIGRLASGEAGAFSGVKRIRACREIFRQRVGADHRLLFRLNSGTIELVALINRRDLERKIKSLTGS